MKVKRLIELKDKCEKKLQSLDMALNISGQKFTNAVYDDKITLTISQAEDVKELLRGYYNILTDILDKAEVEL